MNFKETLTKDVAGVPVYAWATGVGAFAIAVFLFMRQKSMAKAGPTAQSGNFQGSSTSTQPGSILSGSDITYPFPIVGYQNSGQLVDASTGQILPANTSPLQNPTPQTVPQPSKVFRVLPAGSGQPDVADKFGPGNGVALYGDKGSVISWLPFGSVVPVVGDPFTASNGLSYYNVQGGGAVLARDLGTSYEHPPIVLPSQQFVSSH